MSLVGDLLKEIVNAKIDEAAAWLDSFLTEKQQQTLLEGLIEGRMSPEAPKLPAEFAHENVPGFKKPFIPDQNRPSKFGDCEKELDSHFRGDNHGRS
jgi:hypothetical protein